MMKFHVLATVLACLSGLSWGSPAATASVRKPAAPTIIRGAVYEEGTDREKILFQYERRDQTLEDGRLRSEAVFTDVTSGEKAYSEIAVQKDGQVQQYEWTHYQMGESGKVEVQDGKAHYRVVRKGAAKTDEEDARENLVIGPTIVSFLQSRWSDLMSGKDVPVRVGVPDRMDDFGFKFSLLKREKRGDQEVAHVRLKASSLFIAAIVDPIHFQFSADGSKLLTMSGTTLLKVKEGNEWRDLKAETVFRSP